MEELILIDGNSLLFKAFYATSYTGNYMVNRNGIPTNGVYGFARMVEKIISINPKYVIVAFDYGKKTFRNELLDTYKATRKETPQELVPQFALAREYLTAHSITWYEVEGYEGDDIIGTLVDFGEKNNLKVSVYTGDKDANQLISPQTTIYRTVKGVTELDIYNEQTLLDKYGLKPDQFRDFLGLMGDSSDNIPGIKGVGEKTALKLLHQYGTIEGLQEHQDEIKGKMGEKIRAGMEDALMSKKVATILRDIPIDVDLEKATYQGYDYETLKSFYEKYDMNSLIKSMTTEAAPKKELKLEIVDHMPEITKDSAVYPSIYDTNYHRSIILGYGIYNDEQAYFISYENALKDESLLAYLKDENKKKYGYVIYGMSEFTLSRDTGMSIKNAKAFIDKYFKMYPEVKAYMKEVVETCKKQGCVSTLLNRKRYISTINDNNFMVRQQAQREAMNTPIQGTGADILKLAMIEVDKALKEKHLKSQMLLQVHDELIFDVFEDELEEVMSLVKDKMEHCIKLDVPLTVESNCGRNWSELK